MEHAVAKSGRHHGFRDSEDAEDLLLAEEKAEAKRVTKNCTKLTVRSYMKDTVTRTRDGEPRNRGGGGGGLKAMVQHPKKGSLRSQRTSTRRV